MTDKHSHFAIHYTSLKRALSRTSSSMAGKQYQQLKLSSFFKRPRGDDQDDHVPSPRSTIQDQNQRINEPTMTAHDAHHAQFVQKFHVPSSSSPNTKRARTIKAQASAKSTNATSSSSSSSNSPSGLPYTPLEMQVLDLKQRHPDVLLAIEVGYKFRFFGEDAKVASRVLHIAHYMDRNFCVASIPVHRLHIHVQRLVHAGYKVGVVRQTETAALKAAGDNRHAPFERRLQQLYTKGTLVDEMGRLDTENDDTNTGDAGNQYLMCIIEEKRGGSGPDELVHIGILAVQPATGDTVYDAFEDGYMRSGLETRLLHIEPCELLLPSELSKPTEKLIQSLTGQRAASAPNDPVRIERMPANDTLCHDDKAAFTHVTGFYATCQQNHIVQGNTRFFNLSNDVQTTSNAPDNLLSDSLQLPPAVMKALAVTLRYLSEFGLERALRLAKYFVHFSSRSHMILQGNTMANLEIYRNSTTHSTKGSLFSILNQTHTKFGRRLLRSWVGHPLLDKDQLQERFNAVEELVVGNNPKKERAQTLLRQLPDLEKGLCRIHYGKATPEELVKVLDALLYVSNSFYDTLDVHPFESSLLNTLIARLAPIRDDVAQIRNAINSEALGQPDCKLHLLKSHERWPEIPQWRQGIESVEETLETYLRELQQSTRIPSLTYAHVAGVEYQLQVKNTHTSQVPQAWIKMSGTKAVSRFHTAHIIAQLKERERFRERWAMAADAAYVDFQREISEKYEDFRDVVRSLAQLDCLLSLAKVARREGYCKPVLDDRAQLHVVQGRHPMVEQQLGPSYVPNDIQLDSDSIKTLILTGPNMGGKSSYIRQVALTAIMGQIGSYVPAVSAQLGIFDAVYTRMGAMDNMLAGESTFMVELHETAEIMRRATPRSLVVLDELGRGTSTHDGMAISYAVLHHLITRIQPITLFVTHYPSLAELASAYPESTVNGHMQFLEQEGQDVPHVVFLYKLGQGVASASYGLNVARLACLPNQVLIRAQQKAAEMEQAMTQLSEAHQLRKWFAKMRQ